MQSVLTSHQGLEEEMIRAAIILFMFFFIFANMAMAGMEPHLDDGDDPELPPCIADGNDSSVDAVLLNAGETVIEVVCPDDPIDYYYFDVPTGADVSGSVIITTSRAGTVARLAREDTTIFEGSTTDTSRRITIPVSVTDAAGARFFLRITYYSAHADTHYYMIESDLTLTGCFEEGNDTKETAERVFFGSAVNDSFCVDDSVDWYWFHINEDREATDGWIKIDPCDWPSRIEIYDRHDTLIAGRVMEAADEEFKFSDIGSIRKFNSYYVKVEALDYESEDLDEYRLTLGIGEYSGTLMMPRMQVMHPGLGIWPSQYHDKSNTSHTFSKGPSATPDITAYNLGHTTYVANCITTDTNGKIYFINYPDELVCVDDTNTTQLRKRYQNKLSGPFLDSEGAWTTNADFIYQRKYDGTRPDPVELPSDMPQDAKMLALADDKLYFACGQGEDELWCVSKNGNKVFSVDCLAPIYRIAVDRSNNIYVTSFYYTAKYSPAGILSWRDQLHDAPEAGDEPFTGTSTYVGVPCIGPDDRVFVAYVMTSGKVDYKIYNQDGTVYKHVVNDTDDMPAKVARDSAGNIYIVTYDLEIMKFDKELNGIWKKPLPGIPNDMIIDGNDRLYIAFHVGGGLDFWTIRSMTAGGDLLWQVTLDDVPYSAGEPAWLAIGANGKLIFITHNAWMAVLEGEGLEAPTMEPGAMQPAGSSSGSKSLKMKKKVIR